jgi:hypothetical protein
MPSYDVYLYIITVKKHIFKKLSPPRKGVGSAHATAFMTAFYACWSFALLPGGLFLGRRTQNRPNKNPSSLGNLRPRNWPNSKNAA